MAFYRLLLTLATPVIAALLLGRLLRRTETWGDLAERLGGGGGQAFGPTGAIWIHGASNGELTSARRLIEAVRAAHPGRPLVVTANTTSARAMVAGWGVAGLTARLAPLDYRLCLRRFRARVRPAALVMLENEFWPNRIVTNPGPVISVAARMSDRSARRWSQFAAILRPVLAALHYLAPQDLASGARLTALGLPRDRLGAPVELKSEVALPPPDPAELARYAALFLRGQTVLAASTHPGEEGPVLDAFAQALVARPALRLILAPRHPRRSDEVLRLIQARGLRAATRDDAAPAAGTQVLLANSLGEMALWYALAGVTFVGGSLVEMGGHTPFEPAQFGSAILTGPHVANFSDAYGALVTAGGARRVADTEALARAILELTEPGAAGPVAAQARETVAALSASSGGVDRVVEILGDRLRK